MADVACSGTLFCADGTIIPVYRSDLAEGTEEEVQTYDNYSVTAMSVGTYAQGKTVIASSPIMCKNGAAYAYLLRQGKIIQIYPVGVNSSGNVASLTSIPTCNAVTLMAGDKLMVMANTASDREAALSVYTNQGVSHIFTVTPSGGATNNMVSILTGNNIGDTLQGQVVTKAWLTSIDGTKIISGAGVMVADDRNTVVGSVSSTDPSLARVLASPCAIPIGLNYQAQLITAS